MDQPDNVVRNAEGQPFSKWKPRERFAYFWLHDKPCDIVAPDEEYLFDATRKWRFDFAWPAIKLAVEIDGFGFGHQAQQRISENNEKRNAAVAQGWRVLVYDSILVKSKAAVSEAVEQVCRVICGVS